MAGSMTSAFREAANRRHGQNFDQRAGKLAAEFKALRPGEYHVSLEKPADPKLKVMNEVLREQAKRQVN